jgi:hypothetical protein
MLEAQASLQPDTRDGIAKQGDVIVIALAGHPWGTLDQKQLLVVQWQDDAAELALLQRQQDGEEWPVVGFPYAVWDATTTKIVQRSTQTIDLASVTFAARGGQDTSPPSIDVLDPTVEKPIVDLGSYTLVAEPVSPGILTSVASAIASPFVAAWNWLVGS